MKYTFTLTEAGQEREKKVLESRSGESARHIALKILAYLIFREEAAPLPLRIEPDVGQRHRPDLVATEPGTDRVLLWIDCGQIETKRLGRIAAANPTARIAVVKPTAAEARAYALAALRYLPKETERRSSIRFLGFREDFLMRFLSVLRGANDLQRNQTDQTEEETTFVLNGEAYSTTLRLFTADEIAGETS